METYQSKLILVGIPLGFGQIRNGVVIVVSSDLRRAQATTITNEEDRIPTALKQNSSKLYLFFSIPTPSLSRFSPSLSILYCLSPISHSLLAISVCVVMCVCDFGGEDECMRMNCCVQEGDGIL
ncbi:hypothetical protein FXO38_35358 [Capsicum annuum]|nr:hypothetical protein FXO38_35358 [Capsicum annuum]